MLVLTRKVDDSLIIEIAGQSEPVEIKITELSAGQVRLGITAPQSCRIWRSELYQTVVSNRQAAGGSDLASLRQQMKKLK